ncbi:MAG TPA: transcriptional regulator GcvA [Rhizomicrobium sp.]|nr:transcriptional regulator GcvA [Rhizomicrobium sp.]
MNKPHIRRGRRVPPLNPLRAFEAAARHLSFTNAADELCVTQGAISRSIKALENYMGTPLFERTGHGLTLTENSRSFSHALTEIFTRLADETDKFAGVHSQKILTVRAYTSFLMNFLIPILPDFQLHHPDVKVRLISATDKSDLENETFDVRIRYGRGHWKDLESVLLFHDEVSPVCSPSILSPEDRPYPVEVLKDQTLLHPELRHTDWPDWLALAGANELVPHDNLHFDELSVTYQAAIAGLGLAMGQRVYLRNELSSGQLFHPFDLTLRREFGYYLVYPRERKDNRDIVVFRDWLVEASKTALDRTL